MKVSDAAEAKEYGIDTLPSVLYFENKIPSLYDEDLNNENELLEWLIEQKTTDTIEHVTEEILEFLIEDEEYLAVFFSGPCEEDDPCDDILEDLVHLIFFGQLCNIYLPSKLVLKTDRNKPFLNKKM